MRGPTIVNTAPPMRTSQCPPRAVAPLPSVSRDRANRRCGQRDSCDLAALTPPETPSSTYDTPLRAFHTWTKWEKQDYEFNDGKYNSLPPFLFHQPLLTLKSERELLAKAQQEGPEADEARIKLVEANLKFVQYLAVRYCKLTTPAFGLEDLFQEGVIGLNRAISSFDPLKSATNRFTTYAASHIWAAMQRAVGSTSDTVYFPHRHRSSAWAVLRTAEKLTQTLERDPTYGEISTETAKTHSSLGITPNYIALLVREGILQSHPPCENHYIEHSPHLLAATDLATPEEASRAEELARIAQILSECWADFSARNLEVLLMRHPLDPDQAPKTLEEVGEHFNVSKQRIQQIETEALAVLKKRLRRHGIRSVPE